MKLCIIQLIISCTRSWNYARRLLWRSTTESKNIVKILAISQTIHTVCSEDNYFLKGKFKLFNTLFHLVYLVFPKSLFSIAICLPWVICESYVKTVNTVLWHSVHGRHSHCLACFTWIVYVRTYCIPIATLNQNKQTLLIYLGDAQIIINVYSDWSSNLIVCSKGCRREITLATKGREDCDPFCCHLLCTPFALSRWRGQHSPWSKWTNCNFMLISISC